MKSDKGFSLIELIITIAIISILSMIAVPAYVGQQRNATRSEAYQNLSALRLLEEQFFSDNSDYTADAGACAADSDNIVAIQTLLPGFQPGTNPSFSYCVESDVNLAGAATANCFRAQAIGNTGSRVVGEAFAIDCNNNRNF